MVKSRHVQISCFEIMHALSGGDCRIFTEGGGEEGKCKIRWLASA